MGKCNGGLSVYGVYIDTNSFLIFLEFQLFDAKPLSHDVLSFRGLLDRSVHGTRSCCILLNPTCLEDMISALPHGFHYSLPPASADACQCSTVFWIMISTCSYCQGDGDFVLELVQSPLLLFIRSNYLPKSCTVGLSGRRTVLRLSSNSE